MVNKEDLKNKLKDYVTARHNLLTAINLSEAKEIIVYVNMVDDLFNPIITLASGECNCGGNCTKCSNFLQFSPSSTVRKLATPKFGEQDNQINIVKAICMEGIKEENKKCLNMTTE